MFDFSKNNNNNTTTNNIKEGLSLSENITAKKYPDIGSFSEKFSYKGKDLKKFAQRFFSLIAVEMEISKGIFFIADEANGKPVLKHLSGYACNYDTDNNNYIEFGEGFPGQVAKDGKLINISDIPEGYMTIESGLGKSSPVSLIIFPVKNNEKTIAVVELASFHKFTFHDEEFFEKLSPILADEIIKCITKA